MNGNKEGLSVDGGLLRGRNGTTGAGDSHCQDDKNEGSSPNLQAGF